MKLEITSDIISFFNWLWESLKADFWHQDTQVKADFPLWAPTSREGGNPPTSADKLWQMTRSLPLLCATSATREYLLSLSPSSFKEDTLMVDGRKAGNTDQRGNKCLKMSWTCTGIYLRCRHMQDRFITSAWIYGRGAVMLRLLMDCREVYANRARWCSEDLDVLTAELPDAAASPAKVCLSAAPCRILFRGPVLTQVDLENKGEDWKTLWETTKLSRLEELTPCFLPSK